MDILVFILLLTLFSFLIAKDFLRTSISAKNLLLGWVVKLGFAVLFILIYTYYFSDGKLYGDAASFINDGKVLADFAKKAPLEFSKAFFGINSNDLVLHQTYLAETNIWSYGDNGDFINDNRLIIRINALIHLISFGNIWVHALCFAFLSYTGIQLIYKAFSGMVNRPLLLFYGLLLFPSISFWSSGITKESILVFAMGLFFFALIKLHKKEQLIWATTLLLSAISLLLFNKPHVGLVLLPLIAIFLLIMQYGYSRKSVLIIGLSLICGLTVLSFTPSKFNLVERVSYKQRDLQNLGVGGVFFINDSAFCQFDYQYVDHFKYDKEKRLITVTKETEGEYKLFGQSDFYPFKISASDKKYDVYHVIEPSKSIVAVPPINNSPLQLLKNTPLSVLNVLIRPFPNDGGSALKHALFVENILFLILVVLILKKRVALNDLTAKWFYYLLFSGFSLILIIGWTTPILGAVARYKMAPLLLIVIALCLILPSKKSANERPI